MRMRWWKRKWWCRGLSFCGKRIVICSIFYVIIISLRVCMLWLWRMCLSFVLSISVWLNLGVCVIWCECIWIIWLSIRICAIDRIWVYSRCKIFIWKCVLNSWRWLWCLKCGKKCFDWLKIFMGWCFCFVVRLSRRWWRCILLSWWKFFGLVKIIFMLCMCGWSFIVLVKCIIVVWFLKMNVCWFWVLCWWWCV